MTISAIGVRAVYDGSGSTGPFSLQDSGANPILFANNSEIKVTKISTAGVQTVLTITTHYTLTGAGSGSAGAVTLISALLTGEKLVIQRVTPRVQDLDLTYGGSLSHALLEAIFDELVRIEQEDAEVEQRSVQMPITYTGGIIFAPEPLAEAYIGWNSTALALENKGVINSLRSGIGAPSDASGIDGDFYLDTASHILYGPKSGGVWGLSSISLIGPTGATGAAGAAGAIGATGATGTLVRSGAGAPGAGLGNDGDFYIDTVAYDLYGPKAGGAWPAGQSLIGPSGSGTGDVVGPAVAVSGNFSMFSGTTGKLIADSTYAPSAFATAGHDHAATYQLLDGDLTALAALSTTGFVTRTAANTFAQRAITGTAAEITATNGDGVSGAPTLSLPTAMTLTGKTLTGGTLSGPTLSGAIDASGATSLALPVSATPTVDANGEIALDTTVTDFSHGLIRYWGGEECVIIAVPVAETVTPVNGDVITYNTAAAEFQLTQPAAGGGSAPSAPQGRLTLATLTPVMTTTQSAKTTVYYTPYRGQHVPLYDGSTAFTMTDTGGELSQATTDTTKSPAAVVPEACYDVFIWDDGGTKRATRGPAWSLAATITVTIATPAVVTWTTHGLFEGDAVVFTTTGALPTGITAGTVYYVGRSPAASTFNISTTVANAAAGTFVATSGSQSGVHTGTNRTRSRGTGAGTTELVLTRGFNLNTNAVTNGPAALRGTYVGTIKSNASSQIDWIFGATAAGGTAAVFGVWNAFNKVDVATRVADSTDSWVYTSATWRSANASTALRVNFVVGLTENKVDAVYSTCSSHTGSGTGPTEFPRYCAIGHGSTNSFSSSCVSGIAGLGEMASIEAGVANPKMPLTSYLKMIPPIGSNYLQPIESAITNTGSATWYGDNATPTVVQLGLLFSGMF